MRGYLCTKKNYNYAKFFKDLIVKIASVFNKSFSDLFFYHLNLSSVITRKFHIMTYLKANFGIIDISYNFNLAFFVEIILLFQTKKKENTTK